MVVPTAHQQYGSFYRLANVDFKDKALPQPTPIGMQYFNRPGRQSAFTLDMTQMKDLNLYPGVERIFFRHDAEANLLVYDICQQGRKFLPSDSLAELVDRLKQSDKYSISAVEMVRKAHYADKSEAEMQFLIESYGLEVVPGPVIGFDSQQVQREWDEWQREGAQRFLTALMIIPVI